MTEALRRQKARQELPPAEKMYLLEDFEPWAEKVLSGAAWAYYRSAAEHDRCESSTALCAWCSAVRMNAAKSVAAYNGSMEALRRYILRPRMLRDMSNHSTKTEFMGFPCELPIYVSPSAMAKLGHPLGEVNITKAAGDAGIVQAGCQLIAFCP